MTRQFDFWQNATVRRAAGNLLFLAIPISSPESPFDQKAINKTGQRTAQ